jgi:flagellar hook-associated protein 1 FlgK
MSLTGALNIGKSALAAQQAALQVTGNNIANAGNPNYTRQVSTLLPNKDQQIQTGIFVGTGVNLTAIQRQIDEALQGRLRGSTADAEGADTTQQWLGRIESVFNELGDDDLSTRMSNFLGSWSNLANTPQDMGLRQVVLQNGQSVASSLRTVSNDLGDLRTDVDQRLAALANNADQLAQQVAGLNSQIVVAEGGSGGQANGLRDQRDAVLTDLSKLINIKTIPQDNGTINVYVGSEPLVMGTQSLGVALKQQTVNNTVVSTVVFKSNGGAMRLDDSGQLGALYSIRTKDLQNTIDQVDGYAKNLIYEMNKIHASGQGLQGFDTVTSTNAADDTTVPLNDPTSALPFTPQNGSFVVHVTDKATGLVTSTLVKVDLDGLNGDDTTLDSLSATLDGIDNVSASISAGKLTIKADSSAVNLSFSQDSSGTLAALGINTFFTGRSAADIAVNDVVNAQPALLAAAQNGQPADNQTAMAIAALESQPVAGLGGVSLKDNYQQIINGISVAANTAKTDAEATRVVNDTLSSQREALSGVSLDEEAVNLMRQQRGFQAAARLISAVDEMMQTILQLT